VTPADWILLVFAVFFFGVAGVMAHTTRKLNRVLLRHSVITLNYLPEIAVVIAGVILILIVVA
jgi:hypothetical protein